MTSIVTELDKEVSEFPHNKFTLFFSRFHSGLRYKLRAAEQAESGVDSRNGKNTSKDEPTDHFVGLLFNI